MAKTMTAASASTSLVRDGARSRSGISQMPNVSARSRSAAVGTSTAVSTATATSAHAFQPKLMTDAAGREVLVDDKDVECFLRAREESQRHLESLGYTEETFYALVAEVVSEARKEMAEQGAFDRK